MSDAMAEALIDPRDSKGRSPAIERAARILQLLESMPQRGFSAAEIAKALGIPKSTTLNICGEMLAVQLIRRSNDGFQLGRRLVQLGAAYVNSVDIIRAFYSACRSLPPEMHCLVQLAVLNEELDAVYLARHDNQSGLQLGLRAEVGRRTPANCSGIGKALLASLPPYDLEKRIAHLRSLPTLTERSISRPEALREELARIRERGYATDDEEVLPGISCVATSTRTNDREDGLIAVSITGQKADLTPAIEDLRRRSLFEIVSRLQAQI